MSDRGTVDQHEERKDNHSQLDQEDVLEQRHHIPVSATDVATQAIQDVSIDDDEDEEHDPSEQLDEEQASGSQKSEVSGRDWSKEPSPPSFPEGNPEDEVGELRAAKPNTKSFKLFKNTKSLTVGRMGSGCDFQIRPPEWDKSQQLAEKEWFRIQVREPIWAIDPKQRQKCRVFLKNMCGHQRSILKVGAKVISPEEQVTLQWGDRIEVVVHSRTYLAFSVRLKIVKASTEIITTTTGYQFSVNEESDIIGRGEYSRVFLSDMVAGPLSASAPVELNRRYACKLVDTLKRDWNQQEREALAYEIQILKALSHERILRFIDVAEVQHKTYIFTEYIHGKNLADYVADLNGYVPESDIKDITVQLCSGVEYLHNIGIVHRDIKSANIMVDSINRVTLIDFGLARSTESFESMKTHCGTPSFMAPEIREQELNTYSTPVDMWSIGIVLFHMLTNKYPFDQDTFDAFHRRMNKDPGPYQSQWREKTRYNFDWKLVLNSKLNRSSQVRDFLQTLLCIDPSKRITAKQSKHHPWMLMTPEQLEVIPTAEDESLEDSDNDDSGSPRSSGTVGIHPRTSAGAPPAWGQLKAIPGSIIYNIPQTIMLHSERTYIGRDRKLHVYIPDPLIGAHHCMIHRQPNGIVMVLDNSLNGTYINNQKIGIGMSGQLMDGDILGILVQPDDSGTADKVVNMVGYDQNQLGLSSSAYHRRFLKYAVRLVGPQPMEVEDLPARRYEPWLEDPVMVKRKRVETREEMGNLTKLRTTVIPPYDQPTTSTPTGSLGDSSLQNEVPMLFSDDDEDTSNSRRVFHVGDEWGSLRYVNPDQSIVIHHLNIPTVTVGRDPSSDIILKSSFISRAHFRILWKEQEAKAVLINLSANFTKVNGETFLGEFQLRDGDRISVPTPTFSRSQGGETRTMDHSTIGQGASGGEGVDEEEDFSESNQDSSFGSLARTGPPTPETKFVFKYSRVRESLLPQPKRQRL